MSILQIRLFGDPVLTERSQPVTAFDATLAKLGADLFETMKAAHGIGLAAPQVGVLQRVFAFDVGVDEETGEHHFGVAVNPAITRREGEQTGEEGCLSLPGLYYDCTRAMTVDMSAVDVEGGTLEITGEGVLARVFQHEIDHLDGVMFLERLSRGERRRAMRDWRNRDLDLELAGAEPHLHASAMRHPGAAL